jgi:hypothetical protein
VKESYKNTTMEENTENGQTLENDTEIRKMEGKRGKYITLRK